MTREPDTIGADEPVAEAIRRMDEFSYRYLPVIEDGKVIGVISTRHLPFGDVSPWPGSCNSATLWPSGCGRPSRLQHVAPGGGPEHRQPFRVPPGSGSRPVSRTASSPLSLPHSWPRIDPAQGEGAPDLRILPSVNRGRMR